MPFKSEQYSWTRREGVGSSVGSSSSKVSSSSYREGRGSGLLTLKITGSALTSISNSGSLNGFENT